MALGEENPPRGSSSKSLGGLLPGERSPLPTMEAVGPLSDRRKSLRSSEGGRFSLEYESGHSYVTLE